MTFTSGQILTADQLNTALSAKADAAATAAAIAAIPGSSFTQAGTGAVVRTTQNKLRETVSVEDFGAVGDGVTNDTPAIQAAFSYVQASGKPIAVHFSAKRYYLATGLTLPSVNSQGVIYIVGNGAELYSDQAITFLGRVPTTQAQADVYIGQAMYNISGLTFTGASLTGQVGLHLGACYTPVVSHCHFFTLDYGSIGTFCLAGHWRDLRYSFCKTRPLTIQSAYGPDFTPVWTDGNSSNAASNVNTIENVRVYGASTQTASFSFYGSDACVLRRCISEGSGALYDVLFDYQSSSVCKHFDIDGFHCEAPDAKVNFKIKATGRIKIHGVVRSYPAAFLDASGSSYPNFIISGVPYWNNMPSGTDPLNPNGRWFYHVDGGGYGGTEGGTSNGSGFLFEGCDGWRTQIATAAHWENATRPSNALQITGARPSGEGFELYNPDYIRLVAGNTVYVDGSLTTAPTWNNGATVFTAVKTNVTDTASDAGSLLFDLQVASVSKIKVDKNGNTYAKGVYGQGGSSGAFNGFFLADSKISVYTNNGTLVNSFHTDGMHTGSASQVGWAASGDPTGSLDTGLARGAVAGLVSVTNGSSGSGAIAAITKAGAFVAADIPVGGWTVGRDTTNLTTKVYYNNAGTLMSVALT